MTQRGHGRQAEDWTERYLSTGFDVIVDGSANLEVDGV